MATSHVYRQIDLKAIQDQIQTIGGLLLYDFIVRPRQRQDFIHIDLPQGIYTTIVICNSMYYSKGKYASASDVHRLQRPSLASSPVAKENSKRIKCPSSSSTSKQQQRVVFPKSPLPRYYRHKKTTTSFEFAEDATKQPATSEHDASSPSSHDDTIGVGDRYKSLRSELRKQHGTEVPSVSKSGKPSSVGYYRRSDRYADDAAEDNTISKQENEVIYALTSFAGSRDSYNHRRIRSCDTVTTAQETMTQGSFTAATHSHHHHHHRTSVSEEEEMTSISEQKVEEDQAIVISANQAEQQGIEIFSPRVNRKVQDLKLLSYRDGREQQQRDEAGANRNDEEDFGEFLATASSISTAPSTLANNDPQQQHVQITGIKKTGRNYEIYSAASTESTSSEEDALQTKFRDKSLLDASTFSGDDDDDDRKLNKMSDQTRQFQQWMGIKKKNDASGVPSSWSLKPAPLEIPASQQGVQRQSNSRGGLIDSLGSSRRSMLSTGVKQEQSTKLVDSKQTHQEYSAQQFLESAERLEREKQAKEKRDNDDADASRSSSLFSDLNTVLKQMGKSLYSCNGKWYR